MKGIRTQAEVDAEICKLVRDYCCKPASTEAEWKKHAFRLIELAREPTYRPTPRCAVLDDAIHKAIVELESPNETPLGLSRADLALSILKATRTRGES